MPGTLLRASKIQTASVGSPFWKKMTLAFTPWLFSFAATVELSVRPSSCNRAVARINRPWRRRERAARQTQHRVQVAVLHQNLEDFARLALEQTVVRQHHRGSPARLQSVHDVLYEVELLVAGLDGEVVPRGSLIGFPRAERRISQDDIEPHLCAHRKL